METDTQTETRTDTQTETETETETSKETIMLVIPTGNLEDALDKFVLVNNGRRQRWRHRD